MGNKTDSEYFELKSEIYNRTEDRTMYSYKLDKLAYEMQYKVKIIYTDSIIKYHYYNLPDSTRITDVKFLPKTSQLFFGPFEFKKIKNDVYYNGVFLNKGFDLYELKEPVVDGNGAMLFKENYGLLNIDNAAWGYQYLIFPNDYSDQNLEQEIIDLLKTKNER
ncbi:hypothetical protein EV197_2167 [Aquimarina brevivitae]|uniref:Uncharacterized protein n=2 Tax=Aquimarina brevivitae TaxID=323412 RepID=A0A4Q7P1Y1_9FLAO|nr:hypothetical protein EV197_2167 [Aquimarina brevivitae]